MKINDIFDRLKKKDEVPVSLFPCSSMHRTSMQIGRAVPMYSLPMFQGNKVEIDVNQLTRFMTMKRPVMNNYEVNYGFYFCPYKAFDELGESSWFRKVHADDMQLHQNMANCKLNADEFFNPAFDNALRHHPKMIPFKMISNVPLVGSLYDHLGYYIGQNEENKEVQSHICFVDFERYVENEEIKYQFGGEIEGFDMPNSLNDTLTTMFAFEADEFNGKFYPRFVRANGDVEASLTLAFGVPMNEEVTEDTTVVLPFDMFLFDKWANRGTSTFDRKTFREIMPLITSLFNRMQNPAQSGDEIGNRIMRLIRETFDMDIYTPYETLTEYAPSGLNFEEVFGFTPRKAIQMYESYITSMSYKDVSFSANCVDWLAYMRIYADWFLNDHFTRRDDFLDMIANAYYGLGNGPIPDNYTVTGLFEVGKRSSDIGAEHGNGKLFDNPELDFFADYIRRGECLPVLWQLDRYTAARCEVDIQGVGGLEGVDSPLSHNDTYVGSTIREHFFNRAVQKFKDLISRVGYDFRNNTREMYGSGVSDSTLNRSQLIAVRKFDVNVGDIQQTSATVDADNKLGDFAGYAYSYKGTDKISWTAEQNGVFMVIAWVRPMNVAIASGIDREKLKSDYLDYLIPSFGGTGFQDIRLPEVLALGDDSTHNAVFGKEEIYSEYMSKPNYCTGNMRTFNRVYHNDRFLDTSRVLELSKNKSPEVLYITEKDDINRIFADLEEDPIVCTAYFKGNVTRQLPSRIRTDF